MTDIKYFHKCDCGEIIHTRDSFQNEDGKFVRGCKHCLTVLPAALNNPSLEQIEELPTWNYSIGSDTYPIRLVRRISKTKLELEHGNGRRVTVSRRKNGQYKPVGVSGSGGYWPHTQSFHDLDPHF